MSNGQRVDGDDMTYWWQLGDTGDLGGMYLNSDTGETPRLYGTMHNGEVKGVAIADVPAGNDVLKRWWRHYDEGHAASSAAGGMDTRCAHSRQRAHSRACTSEVASVSAGLAAAARCY